MTMTCHVCQTDTRTLYGARCYDCAVLHHADVPRAPRRAGFIDDPPAGRERDYHEEKLRQSEPET
jgi:hypothetical protein